VSGQITAVLNDIGTDAIKIGMLHSSEVIKTVRKTLAAYPVRNIVLDPVMVATSGDKLLQDDAIETLKKELIPVARIITPNIPEAEILLGECIQSQKTLAAKAEKLSANLGVSVLLKAGHLSGNDLADILFNAEDGSVLELNSKRISTKNTHGTGCTLSSAIASFLALGLSLSDAVRHAKDYIAQAIVSGTEYTLGKGHGPVHHFYKYWE
jgi:hydroxymethylpyrimidine/phosphomethylpyrimidine kinase